MRAFNKFCTCNESDNHMERRSVRWPFIAQMFASVVLQQNRKKTATFTPKNGRFKRESLDKSFSYIKSTLQTTFNTVTKDPIRFVSPESNLSRYSCTCPIFIFSVPWPGNSATESAKLETLRRREIR